MKKITLCTFLLISFYHFNYSQGCNDAGFCSVGDMKPLQQLDSTKSELGVSSMFRLGEKETIWLTIQPSAGFSLWRSGKLSIQAPFHFIYGTLGFVSGVGDITPAFTQELFKNDSVKLSLTLGGKIPFDNASQKKNNNPLPMAYQPSQGTWDGIAGISLFHKAWHFSLGFQHNFNSNGNLYIDSMKPVANSTSYFDSRKIDRGDDILLRVEKIFKKSGKPKYFVSVLPIYRIQEATIENTGGERMTVDNSSGLTINVNAGILSKFGNRGNLKLLIGFPTITRHVRPDGLTGTFVISSSVNWGL